MNQYLLDTKVLSELRKGEHCDVNVRNWVDQIDSNTLYLSVVAVGEIRRGIERIRKRDSAHANILERWLVGLKQNFGERLINLDCQIAEEWGRLKAIRPLPVAHGLMAATALAHRMTFVTPDLSGITDLGVPLLNPFNHSAAN